MLTQNAKCVTVVRIRTEG